MTYEGWTNWETWHTALLINNEYDLYQKKVSLVKKKASLSEFKRGLRKAETMTRQYHRQQGWKENDGSKSKFEKVNWKEIYDNMINEEY